MMNILKTYKISFSGLQNGNHSFDFQINDKFFESFEKSRIQKGHIDLKVEMEKSETMIQLHFIFNGYVRVNCDRCLDEFSYPIDFSEMLIVKFGYKTEEESESILVIDPNAYEIELAQYIYEYISLSLPMQLIHPDLDNGESGCNKEFLKNFEIDDSEDEQMVDPRWEALKNLK